VAEKSCAEVLQIRYLGAQEVHDPVDPDGRALYYQVRFLARVRIKEFNPEFEIIERKCFDLTELKSVLGWQANNVIDEIIRRCNVNEL
jgi:hypothetical protein